MKIYKRIMVALDHTYFDRKILNFAGYFTSLFIPENLYFLHIDRDLESADWVTYDEQSDSPVMVPKDEMLKTEIERDVKKHFVNHHLMPLHIDVIEGKPLNRLLHWSRVKNIDLIVVGRKNLSEGSGITATKLARESSCSVLFVPETEKEQLNNVVVPFDFSPNSAHALKKALMLAKHNTNITVQALHVYEAPMFDQYMAQNDVNSLEGNILELKTEAFNEFLKKEGLSTAGIQPVFVRNEHGSTAHQIHDYIQQSAQVDLVIIGANSHSFIGSWLMGSVTEKLLTLQKDVPILVQRNADF